MKENCKNYHTNKSVNFWDQYKTKEQTKNPINKTPNNTNEDDNNDKNEHMEDDNNDQNGFQTVAPKKRNKSKYIPVTISPGEGEKDDTQNEPTVSWAKTTYRKQPKKPKIQIPEATVRQNPEIDTQNEYRNYPNTLNKEGKILKMRTRKLALVQSLIPWSRQNWRKSDSQDT